MPEGTEVKDELDLEFLKEDDSEDNTEDVTDDDDKSGEDHSDDDAGEDKEDDSSLKPKKGGVQKKIDKLTHRMRDLERDNIYLRGQLEGRQAASTRDDAEDDKPETLKRDDYETDEEYLRALNQQNLEILKKEQSLKAEQEIIARKDAENEKRQNFITEQYGVGREKYEDFNDFALNPHSHQVTQEMFDAAMGDNLSDILYVLGKNPGVANKIAGLSKTQQIKEIGKIEARIEKARGIKPKQKTPEDEPIPHLKSTGGSTHSIKSEKDMTMSERMAKWDAEREARLKKDHGLA